MSSEPNPKGFQPGNQHAVKARLLDGLIRKLTVQDLNEPEGKSRLLSGLNKMLDRAAEGDPDAIDWWVCRESGKAIQTVQGDDNAKPLFGSIQFVMIANPNQIKDLGVAQAETIENSPQEIEQAEAPPPLPRSVILGEGGTVE